MTLALFDTGEMVRTWVPSADGVYRYELGRSWHPALPRLVSIGLNPSTADHLIDDPTLRKDVGFAKRWGFGSLTKLNLFAYRATNPLVMKAAKDPNGPLNDETIVQVATAPNVGRVVVSWGKHGTHMGRDRAVLEMLRGIELWCFGVNLDGSPEHELYVPYTRELRRYP